MKKTHCCMHAIYMLQMKSKNRRKHRVYEDKSDISRKIVKIEEHLCDTL